MNSPYLRNFVVARVNPLRFIKGSRRRSTSCCATMTKRARGMNAAKDQDRGRGAHRRPRRGHRMIGEAPRAVIFDLDGTLTEPLLDFDAIRAEIGLPRAADPRAAGGADAETARAPRSILRRHELEAIAGATLADGCAELLALLAARRIPIGHPHPQHPRGGRDFRARVRVRASTPSTRARTGRPSHRRRACWRCARKLGAPPAETLAVGDYKFDVMAGRRAGCRDGAAAPRAAAARPSAEWGSPDLVVRSLRELLPLFG